MRVYLGDLPIFSYGFPMVFLWFSYGYIPIYSPWYSLLYPVSCLNGKIIDNNPSITINSTSIPITINNNPDDYHNSHHYQ